MAVAVRSPEGLLYVGTFVGEETTEAGFHRIVVEFHNPTTGEPIRRGVEYAAFDRFTGEPTPVGAGLAELSPGDAVAIGLWAEGKLYVDKKDGQTKAFATFRATSVAKL